MHEQTGADEDLQSEAMSERTTSAAKALVSPSKMTVESAKCLLYRSVDRDAGSVCPLGEMLGRAQMPAGGDRRVPALAQRLREARDERSGEAGTEALNPGK